MDPVAFCITFHRRRFFGLSPIVANADPKTGYRPFRWTDQLDDAEKFASNASARAFAQAVLPGGYEIRPLFPFGTSSAA